MSDRVLPLLLLLSWQAAMLTASQSLQPLVCALAGLVVGIALVVLMASGLPVPEGSGADDPDDAALEYLALSFPIH